jgi:Flp pilus assembly protein TadD
VALLGEALRDRDDEVRLLAYALLDRTEREVYARIKADTAKLEDAKGPARASLHARLAQHHWELVELGLASGDVAAHLLATAEKHVQDALGDAPGDGNAQVLLGRIELRRGRLAEAEAAFGQALRCGLGEEIIRPYLAEVAFRRRRFDEVRQHVRAVGGDERGAMEPRVATYWS